MGSIGWRKGNEAPWMRSQLYCRKLQIAVFPTACFWSVGGNQSTLWKPTQSRGGHVNGTQRVSYCISLYHIELLLIICTHARKITFPVLKYNVSLLLQYLHIF